MIENWQQDELYKLENEQAKDAKIYQDISTLEVKEFHYFFANSTVF